MPNLIDGSFTLKSCCEISIIFNPRSNNVERKKNQAYILGWKQIWLGKYKRKYLVTLRLYFLEAYFKKCI